MQIAVAHALAGPIVRGHDWNVLWNPPAGLRRVADRVVRVILIEPAKQTFIERADAILQWMAYCFG